MRNYIVSILAVLAMAIPAIGFSQESLGEQIKVSVSEDISIDAILPNQGGELQILNLTPINDNYQYILSKLSSFNVQELANTMMVPNENGQINLIYNCDPKRKEPTSLEDVIEHLTNSLENYGIQGFSILECNEDEESAYATLIPSYSTLPTVSQLLSIQCGFANEGIIYFSGAVYQLKEQVPVSSLLSSDEMLDYAKTYLNSCAQEGKKGIFNGISLGYYYIPLANGTLEGHPVWYFTRTEQVIQSFEDGMNLIGNFAIDCETGEIYAQLVI